MPYIQSLNTFLFKHIKLTTSPEAKTPKLGFRTMIGSEKV